MLTITKGMVEIEPVSGSGSKTKVNGVPLTGRKKLSHKDRLLFGKILHHRPRNCGVRTK